MTSSTKLRYQVPRLIPQAQSLIITSISSKHLDPSIPHNKSDTIVDQIIASTNRSSPTPKSAKTWIRNMPRISAWKYFGLSDVLYWTRSSSPDSPTIHDTLSFKRLSLVLSVITHIDHRCAVIFQSNRSQSNPLMPTRKKLWLRSIKKYANKYFWGKCPWSAQSSATHRQTSKISNKEHKLEALGAQTWSSQHWYHSFDYYETRIYHYSGNLMHDIFHKLPSKTKFDHKYSIRNFGY